MNQIRYILFEGGHCSFYHSLHFQSSTPSSRRGKLYCWRYSPSSSPTTSTTASAKQLSDQQLQQQSSNSKTLLQQDQEVWTIIQHEQLRDQSCWSFAGNLIYFCPTFKVLLVIRKCFQTTIFTLSCVDSSLF